MFILTKLKKKIYWFLFAILVIAITNSYFDYFSDMTVVLFLGTLFVFYLESKLNNTFEDIAYLYKGEIELEPERDGVNSYVSINYDEKKLSFHGWFDDFSWLSIYDYRIENDKVLIRLEYSKHGHINHDVEDVVGGRVMKDALLKYYENNKRVNLKEKILELESDINWKECENDKAKALVIFSNEVNRRAKLV